MERKGIICLLPFVFLILVFTSCHPRHVSDIKPAMTKEEVVSLWGPTNLITHKTVDGKTFETWQYHFASSDSICSVTFVQDRVVTTECHPLERSYYSQLEIQPYPRPYYYYPFYYYPYPLFDPYPYDHFGYRHFYRPHHHPFSPPRR